MKRIRISNLVFKGLLVCSLFALSSLGRLEAKAQLIVEAEFHQKSYQLASGFELNPDDFEVTLINETDEDILIYFEADVPNGFAFINFVEELIIPAKQKITHPLGIYVSSNIPAKVYALELRLIKDDVILATFITNVEIFSDLETQPIRLSVVDKSAKLYESNYHLSRNIGKDRVAISSLTGSVFNLNLLKGRYTFLDLNQGDSYEFIIDGSEDSIVWSRSGVSLLVKSQSLWPSFEQVILIDVYRKFDYWLNLERLVFLNNRLVDTTVIKRYKQLDPGVIEVVDENLADINLSAMIKYRLITPNDLLIAQTNPIARFPIRPLSIVFVLLGLGYFLSKKSKIIHWISQLRDISSKALSSPLKPRSLIRQVDELPKSIEVKPVVSLSEASMQGVIIFGTTVMGNIESREDLWISGEIYGDILCSESCVIDETGRVFGNIETDKLKIRGEFHGKCVANELVISQNANVSGKLNAHSIIIENGARLSVVLQEKK